MERHDLETYGPHLAEPKGYIALPGQDKYRHRFGGDSWRIVDEHDLGIASALILTLDLGDPRLGGIDDAGLDELPLCSYLDCDAPRQRYAIHAGNREVVVLDSGVNLGFGTAGPEDRMPRPLPETMLRLRDMTPGEYPVDEDCYYEACDLLLGGGSMIRVVGPPLWMQWVEEERCRCGRSMEYVAGIGYELPQEGDGALLPAPGFFPGELAMYFVYCKVCREVVTFWQST